MALVYYYFDPKGQSEDSHRATLIATTLVVVMFSITVFGAITKPLLDLTLRGSSRGAAYPSDLWNCCLQVHSSCCRSCLRLKQRSTL